MLLSVFLYLTFALAIAYVAAKYAWKFLLDVNNVEPTFEEKKRIFYIVLIAAPFFLLGWCVLMLEAALAKLLRKIL